MPASKVYFTDFRCRIGVSQLDKLRKLLEQSEFSQIDFDGKFVGFISHVGNARIIIVHSYYLMSVY